jgi:hypothetical protein
MAHYVFHVNGSKVPFDAVPEGALKSLLGAARDELEGKLRSKLCPTHAFEPVVSIVGEDDRLTGFGLGVCCREFGDALRPLMTLTIQGLDMPECTFATRVVKYTTFG